MKALTESKFDFPKQSSYYRGKVRDVYTIDNKLLLMVVSDRISAFDVVLPEGIPYKGQVLNQMAAMFLDDTKHIVPNWKIGTPDPMVTAGLYCEPFKVEMVIRGYLTGHAWREYKHGKRTLCGVEMPDGMKENQKFPKPIITPTTKALVGHDEDITRDEILATNLVSREDYEQLEQYTYQLFEAGTNKAAGMGLILVDTKYEFGKRDGKIYLIDEIHTPDSSRYFYADTYQELQDQGIQQRQLSKEFVREWLMGNNFSGKDGQTVPEMPDEFVNQVSERYIELFEKITGKKFEKPTNQNIQQRIEENCKEFLKKYL
jgi:phosphoribosylaminoimidazole-succinocarboxamide synthase